MKAHFLLLSVLAIQSLSASAVSLEGMQKSLFGAKAPHKPEYLPKGGEASSTKAAGMETSTTGLSFSAETLGAPPVSLTPVVGNWLIGLDGDNRVLVVDGRAWSQGQPAAGIADRARALYGERYAEFLDSVKSYAYFPYAVVNEVKDFREGAITVRFKGMAGRVDQAAGILFDLKPNGDYYTVRANPLEDNLVLWRLERGQRSSVKWVRNTPTPSRQWHELKVEVRGRIVKSWLDGHLYLTHELPQPVSGRIGLWSKSDSVVYFDDLKVTP